jgi:hypothetical protein
MNYTLGNVWRKNLRRNLTDFPEFVVNELRKLTTEACRLGLGRFCRVVTNCDLIYLAC